ncbi:IS30 family transposase [Paraburkholderia youngii]|uniref:helix-turn-helix domain-containing protein n=1 Tax=Paraburkholderia youngii TaxID=2782701 RepID=UPI003D262BDD
MNENKYQRIQPEERLTIASMKHQGLSVRAMARTFGRPASTVSRELARNTCAVRGYASVLAQTISSARRAAAHPPRKLDHPGALSRIVLSLSAGSGRRSRSQGVVKLAAVGQCLDIRAVILIR